ncbi:MAG: glycosyl transferase, partial [Gemmatimonadetes bacterium]|nr:glycosyl transferase [Gemmatimonadota bacterium]
GECVDDDRFRWEPGVVTTESVRDGIATTLEVFVDPEEPLEVRRITIRNQSGRARTLDITTCSEIVLAGYATHAAHPLFSKLFIQTSYVETHAALIAERRARSNDERHPVFFQALAGPGELAWETSRPAFLGRTGSAFAPRALRSRASLAGTTGAVLDPVASLRRSFDLDSDEQAEFVLTMGAASSRERACNLIARSSTESDATALRERARHSAGERVADSGLTPEEANRSLDFAARILLDDPALRSPHAARGSTNAAADLPGVLARHGLSPERPFVLVRPGSDAAFPKLLAKVRRFWSDSGIPIDWAPAADDVDPGDAALLAFTARATLEGAFPNSAKRTVVDAPVRTGNETKEEKRTGASTPPREKLSFFNGCGGFSEDGREYVIRMPNGRGGLQLPPLPWVNVIANPGFGTMISETGAGCTWSGNSREHRLTPWSNDPVRDPHGETVLIHDDEAGSTFSAFPGPAPGNGDYEMRHGFGYSTCRYASDELRVETCVFVAADDPVKITRVRIENRSSRARHLTLTSEVQFVLGDHPGGTGRYARTEHDTETAITYGWNPMAGEHASRAAFHAVAWPRAVKSRQDTIRAARVSRAVPLAIAPGDSVECAFLLGEGADRAQAAKLVESLRSQASLQAALETVKARWKEILSTIRITTPVPEIDLMVNGWLLYQTISCRLDGRTAFYQSGGAFGFRDQLQDSAALVYGLPSRTREQILLNATHQFLEGDVMHWWHPPLSKGIRTRFADDLLWLPYVTSYYVRTTGDWNILQESAPYLSARALRPEEDEAFVFPVDAGESGDLYEHCCRAIDRSFATGRHGLPLFGAGDWNDGMNRVGHGGEGESVWMALFLYRVLGEFIPLCESRGESDRIRRYEQHRERLRKAIDDAGWDGDWYRRGYYGDGTPLGSKTSDECRIDALVQAWAVIADAAPEERTRKALDSVEKYLVSDSEKLIRLLTPPFQDTPHDPGYIKGYVRGVRENGGQYTHAALWVVRAFAEAGRRERAAELLAMLSPVSHTKTPEAVATYKTEPYVVVADVYSEPPHVGRGGWTWYTGSAAWMYRVAIESILGFHVKNGNTLLLRPCIPSDWPGFEIDYHLPGGNTKYRIRVDNSGESAAGVFDATLDGESTAVVDGTASVLLVADGGTHDVRITLG